MAKIILDTVTSTDMLTTINQNFTDVVAEFQDKVLYRDNPPLETNTVTNTVDMDGNDILNVSNLYTTELFVNGQTIEDLLSQGVIVDIDAAIAAAAAAQASATAAGISASNASASATNAATSASSAAASAASASGVVAGAVAAGAAAGASAGTTAGTTAGSTAAQGYDTLLRSDLASTAPTKGSVLIGYSPVIGGYGRSVRDKLTDVVTSRDFGALGNNTQDDTPFLQAAVNYLQSNGGGTLRILPGIYKLTNEIVCSSMNVTISGAGRGATIMNQTNLAANTFRFTGGAGVQEYGTIHSIGFSKPSLPTGGAAIFLDNAPFSNVYNVSIRTQWIGVRVLSGYLSKIQDFDIRDCVANGVLCSQTNDMFIRNFGIITTVPSWFTGGGIRLEDFCEAIVVESGDIVGGVYSLTTDASNYSAGARPGYNRFTNVYFDSASQGVFVNNTVLTNFDSCWFSGGRTAGQWGLILNNTQQVNLNNCSIFNCGGNGGVNVTAGSVRTKFLGCNFESNNGLNLGGAVALHVMGGTGNLTVNNCTFSGGLYTYQQAYGMLIDAGTTNNLTVLGNDFVGGGTSAGYLDNSGGAQKIVLNNRT
jgi:hypothetical protein